MKKTVRCVLLSAVGICSCLLQSCSSDEGGSPAPPEPSGNSFVYDDVQSKIESVVYTFDQAQKSYTFYFSPTQGLVDLDAMLMADDYIRIVTNTPTGSIDLLSANNSLKYKNMDVSSATADNVAKAALSLQLTSMFTAKMSFDVAMKSGQTLRGEYDGTCIKQEGEQPQDEYDVTLTEQIFGYYMGPAEGNAGTNGYQVALTNAEWEGSGTRFDLKSEGYALVLNFYGTPGETWRDMPTGAFTESEHNEDHTFQNDYSAVLYRDEKGQMEMFLLAGQVQIDRDQAGMATITATFLDKDYEEHTIIYRDELKIADATLNVNLPQIDRDMLIEGVYASGVYSGDVFENGNGLTEITIFDQKAEDDEPNGSAITIALFSTKFTNSKECRLVPGTYKGATTYAQGTWMPAVEMEFMGMIVPMGTYGLYADGTQTGQYAYAASGDVVIREGDDKTYTVEFDLQSIAGHSIRGSYTGKVNLVDQSGDNKDDGTSTLKNDYELDLSYLPRTDCFPQSEIWIRGLNPNMTPLTKAWEHSGCEYGFQHIQIGETSGVWELSDEYPITGKLVEGDILGIDLLVEKGMEDKITPGTYPITANRYPAFFRAGVCVCGYNCYYGTSMMRIMSAIGWGYPNGHVDPNFTVANGWLNIPTMGEFASIYSGTVTVAKADGGDNWYTFSIDGRDVLKHRVTGSWTGPVYLGGTDTPVEQSGAAMQTTAKRNLPSWRELKSRTGKPEPLFVNRQSFN